MCCGKKRKYLCKLTLFNRKHIVLYPISILRVSQKFQNLQMVLKRLISKTHKNINKDICTVSEITPHPGGKDLFFWGGMESEYFCFIGLHAKFHNPKTISSTSRIYQSILDFFLFSRFHLPQVFT